MSDFTKPLMQLESSARAIKLLGVVAALVLGSCGQVEEGPSSGYSQPLSVGTLLGSAPGEGFERAIAPRSFRFPEDHGPHEGFRTEWWYYTGHLATSEGRRFGYQLTFFRNALSPDFEDRSSSWATRNVFMAHFAVTDVEGQVFHSFERFAREAVGLSGATGDPFRVWTEDWSAAGSPNGMRLLAQTEAATIDLELGLGKAPVLQGDGGLSQKGAGEGNASYYYSLTRMPTSGSLRVGDETLEVTGTTWMDREWSTSALEAGQVGWDWFSLQLSNGQELMAYVMRRDDGSVDSNSAGVVVRQSGAYRRMALDDWSLEVVDQWQSPSTGTLYPSGWNLAVPSEGLSLDIRPLLADQEFDHSFRYWEGAVALTGTARGTPVDGHGYVELTGYD